MAVTIEKASRIGFCFGVRRAIEILERLVRERGEVETLGPVVHNQPVLNRLAESGARVVKSVDAISGDTVVIGAHGVSPHIEEDIRARHINIVNTTCPYVNRAQVAARRLAESDFFVVIFGDANHAEVKGILAWAKGRGIATLDEKSITTLERIPRRLGVLSQTTLVPAHFTEFVKRLIDAVFTKDSEMRIIDTICHDIRRRQASALDLAKRVDVMLVVGGYNSANTNQLAKLCSTVTQTYLVENADEIQTAWLKDSSHIGITAGASTDEVTINEVISRLEGILGQTTGSG